MALETKKLYAAAQVAQEGAINIIEKYLSNFKFPSEESKKLTKVALLNYCGAAILMPYKMFHNECIKQKYDLELIQNTFACTFEQIAHRVTCLQDPKLPGIPFHFLRVDVAGNISKRFSLSGIEIPRYGGACPRWNVYSAFSRPGVIQAAVSKMTNGEKYVCIARTVEKGVGKYGQKKSMLSIGLGCEAKYAKDFIYTEYMDLSDKKSETISPGNAAFLLSIILPEKFSTLFTISISFCLKLSPNFINAFAILGFDATKSFTSGPKISRSSNNSSLKSSDMLFSRFTSDLLVKSETLIFNSLQILITKLLSIFLFPLSIKFK